MSCCGNSEHEFLGCSGDERKEPEMSKYTKSAEIAGKLLGQMEEVGCKLPAVRLYFDGSGHFLVYVEDEEVAYELLHLRLPEVHFYKHDADSRQGVEFDFTSSDLEKYTSICPTCKRPPDGE